MSDGGAVAAKRQNPPPQSTVRYATSFVNVVQDVFESMGWKRVGRDAAWDVHWCEVGWVHDMPSTRDVGAGARVCHFPTHYELTRKDLCVKNVKKFRRQLEKEVGKAEAAKRCSFMPTTYYLPAEYHMFVEEWKRSPASAWIMKPVGRAQGKGIFLFRKLEDIVDWKRDTRFDTKAEDGDKRDLYIVQQYIPNPFLLGGKKFDLRFYVLVTSFSPLEVWLYREGFARFSGAQFSMDDIADSFVHLTNVAVQKTADGYDRSKGCKMLFSDVKALLVSRYGNDKVAACLADIDNLFITSLQAVQPAMTNDRRCFELYGFDVLLDDTLKPWLIEVNASPSLTADTPSDYKLKFGLLEDLFGVVDVEGLRSRDDTRVGGFDLVWADGAAVQMASPYAAGEASQLSNSHLGGFMGDRKQDLMQKLGQRRLPPREWTSRPHGSHGGTTGSATSGDGASSSASVGTEPVSAVTVGRPTTMPSPPISSPGRTLRRPGTSSKTRRGDSMS